METGHVFTVIERRQTRWECIKARMFMLNLAISRWFEGFDPRFGLLLKNWDR